jgi:hypothetical protein
MHDSPWIKPTLINGDYWSSKAVEAWSTRLDLIGPCRWASAQEGRAGALLPWQISLPFILVPSRVFYSLPSRAWVFSLYVNMTYGPSLVLFSWHPAKIDIHQNSWNSISKPPISMWYLLLGPFMFRWRLKLTLIYRQQVATGEVEYEGIRRDILSSNKGSRNLKPSAWGPKLPQNLQPVHAQYCINAMPR